MHKLAAFGLLVISVRVIEDDRSTDSCLRVQFKKLLNRELSQFAESSKAGTQISEYICSTFLGPYSSAT